MSEQLWWHVARASGLVGMGLTTASILWGLALSTRALGKRPAPAWLLDLHRFLGGLTVVFVGVHVAALVADTYVHFGLADLLVPMASRWKPGPVAWGIVALYVLLAVEITSLLMRRLPPKLWRAVHLSSYLLFATGAIHTFTAGTDAGNAALQWVTVLAVASIVFMTAYRVLAPRRGAARRRAAESGPPSAAPVEPTAVLPTGAAPATDGDSRAARIAAAKARVAERKAVAPATASSPATDGDTSAGRIAAAKARVAEQRATVGR